jgi:uncharacterized membrane protein YkgB
MPKSFAQALGRASLFIIYTWFGILKLIGKSPANELVKALHQRVIPGIPFHQFFLVFAVFEIIIGILFLLPGFSKLVYLLFLIHISLALSPLFLLPQLTWQSFLIPTIEGQYIIKNIALISVVAFLSVHRRY